MQFFPSITGNRVHAVFAALGYPPAVAGVLTGLCTVATPADTLRGLPYAQASQLRTAHLPQGAPTSPALANLVARTFDIRSSALAQANWLAYTRYADDLAFSGIEIADVGTLLWTINQIAQDEGFDVHPRKIKVMRPHRRQHLTGLVINDQPSYPRDDYDRLRALLHNAANTSAQEQNRAGVEHFPRPHLRPDRAHRRNQHYAPTHVIAVGRPCRLGCRDSRVGLTHESQRFTTNSAAEARGTIGYSGDSSSGTRAVGP